MRTVGLWRCSMFSRCSVGLWLSARCSFLTAAMKLNPFWRFQHCAPPNRRRSIDAPVGGPAQHGSRQRAGVPGIFDDDDPIDEHCRAGAGWVLVRLRIGRAVLEVGRIEDRDVGPVTFLEKAAVAQT